jgi:hypothetical protein
VVLHQTAKKIGGRLLRGKGCDDDDINVNFSLQNNVNHSHDAFSRTSHGGSPLCMGTYHFGSSKSVLDAALCHLLIFERDREAVRTAIVVFEWPWPNRPHFTWECSRQGKRLP